jgi:uncharacterized protein (TIGR03083 family)
MGDVWPIVHAERAALLADLEGLDERQFDEPSLCPGWSVHDVVAHLVDTARTTRLRFVVGMCRARFDFDRQNADGIRRERGTTPRQTLDRLRSAVTLTATPPAPVGTRLVEAIVHGEDIRRPLRITGTYPADAIERATRLQARTGVSLGGAKERVAGIRLCATDSAFTLGHGPEARGPAISLLLAISGRPLERGELVGDGVHQLTGA